MSQGMILDILCTCSERVLQGHLTLLSGVPLFVLNTAQASRQVNNNDSNIKNTSKASKILVLLINFFLFCFSSLKMNFPLWLLSSELSPNAYILPDRACAFIKPPFLQGSSCIGSASESACDARLSFLSTETKIEQSNYMQEVCDVLECMISGARPSYSIQVLGNPCTCVIYMSRSRQCDFISMECNHYHQYSILCINTWQKGVLIQIFFNIIN